VLYIPSDEYGVIESQELGPALSLLIGNTPRKMDSADVAQAMQDAAGEYDIPLRVRDSRFSIPGAH